MFDPPSEAQLAEFRQKHGDDMLIIETMELTFVVALPEDEDKIAAYYKRFSSYFDDGKREEAFRSVFPALCVYPDKDTMNRVLRRRPGLVRSIGLQTAELLGVVPSEVKKD